MDMMEAITAGVTAGIGFVGDVVTAIFGASGALAALLPVIGLGIAFTCILFGVKVIRGLAFGM